MDTSYILLFIVIFIIIYSHQRNEKIIARQLKKIRNKKERAAMTELVKGFIGKECIVYTFNSQFSGIIKEVIDGAVLIENNQNPEIINLDYVVRIKEFPRNKNGKKKSLLSGNAEVR